MNEERIQNKTLLWMAGIIGLALLVSTTVGAWAFYRVRSFDNVLSVTGSAKQTVVSDQVKWTANWSRTVQLANLKTGYQSLATDQALVKKFLADNGIAEANYNISAVNMYQNYDYRSSDSSAPPTYTLQQTVTIQSGDIQKITALAKNIQGLVNEGVIFSTASLEYSYSKLPDLRVSLLSDAVKDAKARAEKLAESSGKQVDQLVSASMGVVQVLPVNSVDVSDYGAYDTSEINKDVMVTVKTAFSLK